MTTTDEIAYIPLTYGYSTYATSAAPAVPVRRRSRRRGRALRSGAGRRRAGRLGRHPRSRPRRRRSPPGRAAPRLSTTSSPAPAVSPGHRSAWDDPELDALAGGFYSGTRASIERAWVRPRDDWWPVFQLEAGSLLTDNLLDGDPEDLTGRLHELHRRHSA